MKSVFILAAGKGTRLAPITDQLPKALVPVLGKPILAYTLDALADAAIRGNCNVSIVVGHKGEMIADYLSRNYEFARVIWNHEYARTNNMVSLNLAMTAASPNHDIVFMNGDCLYHQSIIQSALSVAGDFIFCDPDMPHNAEAMKISVGAGVINGISKETDAAGAYAVSCDLYTLSARSADRLRGIIFEFLSNSDLNSWSEVALNKAMERGAIAFKPMSVRGQYWYEIDNHDDLAGAATRVASSQ